MSKYDKETKFYWLQLKEDFFEDDAINWLEEQKPNGRDYAYFYLKLCLKSLKSNGILIRKVGNILIPYDNKKLAELTKMDFDTVCVAMELLKKIGLVQVLDNGQIYLTQLESLIGSKSLGALKKQQQRCISGQVADKCPPKIEIKDRDKDIIRDKNNDLDVSYNNYNNIVKYIEKNFGRCLSPIEYEEIEKWLLLPFEENDKEKIVSYAVRIAVMNNVRTFKYVNGILNNWRGKGLTTFLEVVKDNVSRETTEEDEDRQYYKSLDQEELFDYDWLNDNENT